MGDLGAQPAGPRERLIGMVKLDFGEHQAGGGITLNRHKALWHKYQEIFENVSEERQAFALIFGSEFTAAYRQYRNNSGENR